MDRFIQETSVSVVLIVLLILILNPFGFWMPNTLSMMILIGFVVAFGFFVNFIWKEKARDEREKKHNLIVGKLSSLSGALVLLIGITVQVLNHSIDPWLIGALGVMILTKVVGLIYSRLRK